MLYCGSPRGMPLWANTALFRSVDRFGGNMRIFNRIWGWVYWQAGKEYVQWCVWHWDLEGSWAFLDPWDVKKSEKQWCTGWEAGLFRRRQVSFCLLMHYLYIAADFCRLWNEIYSKAVPVLFKHSLYFLPEQFECVFLDWQKGFSFPSWFFSNSSNPDEKLSSSQEDPGNRWCKSREELHACVPHSPKKPPALPASVGLAGVRWETWCSRFTNQTRTFLQLQPLSIFFNLANQNINCPLDVLLRTTTPHPLMQIYYLHSSTGCKSLMVNSTILHVTRCSWRGKKLDWQPLTEVFPIILLIFL